MQSIYLGPPCQMIEHFRYDVIQQTHRKKAYTFNFGKELNAHIESMSNSTVKEEYDSIWKQHSEVLSLS